MPSSSYRPLTKEPTTRWGRWLVAKRKERGWSQTRAFDELHAGLGLSPKSRTSYRALEEGREPKPHEAAYLVSIFGEPPEDEPEPEEASEPTLAAALTALADELRESRLARETAEARVRALEAAVALLGQRVGVEPQELLAPRGSEGWAGAR